MNIKFRKLQALESGLYRSLRLDCLKQYPENFGSNYEDEIQKRKLFFQTHIESNNSDNFIIGGFYNTDLIAISGFQRYETKKTRHRGRIIQVYVKPEYQGQNIGLNLISIIAKTKCT